MIKNPYRLLLCVVALGLSACVQVQSPTDSGDPNGATDTGSTGGSTPTVAAATTGPFSYNQDIKPILDGDCLVCHGPRRTDGGYSVANYAQVMRAVRAGNASSTLILDTRSGGSMYRYWIGTAGTRQAKADMVRTWIVTNNAQETR